jgi:hypothetical protein
MSQPLESGCPGDVPCLVEAIGNMLGSMGIRAEDQDLTSKIPVPP